MKFYRLTVSVFLVNFCFLQQVFADPEAPGSSGLALSTLVDAYEKHLTEANEERALQAGFSAIKLAEEQSADGNKKVLRLSLSLARLMNQYSGSLEFSDLTVEYAQKAVDRHRNYYGSDFTALLPAFKSLVIALNQRWRSSLDRNISDSQALPSRAVYRKYLADIETLSTEIKSFDSLNVDPLELADLYLRMSLYVVEGKQKTGLTDKAIEFHEKKFPVTTPKALAFRLAVLQSLEGLPQSDRSYYLYLGEKYRKILELIDESPKYDVIRYGVHRGLLRMLVGSLEGLPERAAARVNRRINDNFARLLTSAGKAFAEVPSKPFEWISRPLKSSPYFLISFDISEDGRASNISLDEKQGLRPNQSKRNLKRQSKLINAQLKQARFIPGFEEGFPVSEKNAVII